MITIPTDYAIKLADRLDRHGKVCAACYLLPPGGNVGVKMAWTYCRPGDLWPRGSEFQAIADRVAGRLPVAVFFRDYRDGPRFFQTVMEQREAQIAAEQGARS
jgi:hypothetical protein